MAQLSSAMGLCGPRLGAGPLPLPRAQKPARQPMSLQHNSAGAAAAACHSAPFTRQQGWRGSRSVLAPMMSTGHGNGALRASLPSAAAPGNASGSSSPSATAATGAGGAAAAAPVAPREADNASVAPLRVALDFAQSKLRESTSLREAAEARAQEMGQIAVEAVQARNAAFAARDTAAGFATEVTDQVQVSLLKADAEERAAAAAKAAEEAEAAAAQAMKAAEVAVKEEMQAQAVVKETLLALEKAMGDLSAIQASDDSASAAAVSDKAKAGASASGSKAAGDEASTSKQYPSLLSIDQGDTPAVPKPNYMKWGFILAAGLLAMWAMQNTAIGQQAFAALGSVTDLVKQQLSHIHIHEAERSLLEAIALLATSIVCVPLVVSKIPGGNPVLGYLLGGALVGPYALGIIQDVHSIKHLAEMGVVFLLFNIGLELSMDRLASLAKYVFGMGTLQVVLTLAGVAAFAMSAANMAGPSAIILGGALAMSSTAVGIQVLEDRGEMGSRHGRAIFSVLLLQDLAVVVLLMLIPLLAPSPDGSSGGLAKIAQALGTAAVKAVLCIGGIVAGGRVLIQPLYKKMSEFANAEIFAATTLLVVLGTSFLTSLAGLSLALGAFLAGLLIAETDYVLQVESDIAPYKGLLMGLFFMSVGMEISGQLFLAKWKEVLAGITLLIGGKLAVMAAVGPWFGLTQLAAVRAGLLLAPGGEFAFVAFGEAVARGVLPVPITNLLYLVVALSMALTPYLAALGGMLGQLLDQKDTKALQPKESETKELNDHVIILGYGRSGQLIAQILSENLIPFVAIDTGTDCVAAGKAQDLPVYYGDAGSPAVLHLLGAERAMCAIIALDSPSANYRAVYAMTKHFPSVKTFVRARDVNHGVVLEKAGATAVVPETLEPSLQLAAAALTTLDYQQDEVTRIIDDFRRKNMSQLQQLALDNKTSVGYGY